MSTLRRSPRSTGRRVTADDVARRTGLSAMTVSLVINGSPRISAETRQRVEHAITELGYVPNRLARSLTGHRLGVIAVMVVDISHTWLAVATRAIEEEARQRGETVILCNHGDDPLVERTHLEKLGALRVDGVLLVACGDASLDNLDMLGRDGVPVVLLEREVPGSVVDLVHADGAVGAAALTEHLIGHGHTRICIVPGPPTISTSRHRTAGYQRAMAKAGLAQVDALPTQHTAAAGYQTARELLAGPKPPTGFIAGDPHIALGIMDAIREAGAGPREIGLVSFDDTEISAPDPYITCYELPVREIGLTALDMLEKRIAGEKGPAKDIVIDGWINVRRSCGCQSPEAAG